MVFMAVIVIVMMVVMAVVMIVITIGTAGMIRMIMVKEVRIALQARASDQKLRDRERATARCRRVRCGE